MALENNTEVTLNKAASNHIARVLRLNEGASVILFNNTDSNFSAQITDANKNAVTVMVTEQQLANTESRLHTHIGQGISRGERMDYTIQKATELGVTEITPLFTERCMVKLPGDRQAKRLEHWQQVAISACEQSGRTRIPIIHPPQTLIQWLSQPRDGLKLLCDTLASKPLNQFKAPAQMASILIGPEGGLADQEISIAKSQDFQAISLGPRILRTETAGVVVLSLLQAQFGDV